MNENQRFPMERMHTLVRGFESLLEGEKAATFAFLDALMEDVHNLKNWEVRLWELVISACPLTVRGLMVSQYLISEEAKKHSEFDYWYHFRLGNLNDLPFSLTKAARLGGFPETLLDEFNRLCLKCVPVWGQLHPAARARMELLLGEMVELHPDKRFVELHPDKLFLDEVSVETAVIPPLKQGEIALWNKLSEELKVNPKSYTVETAEDFQKLLRFCMCVFHGQIEGYTHISTDVVQTLLHCCIPPDVTSPFMITEYFNLLCKTDLPTKALDWFHQYGGILCRPASYGGTTVSRSAVHTYVEFMNTPSRLVCALARAARNRFYGVLYQLLEDDIVSVEINNKRAIDDLFQLLRDNPAALRATATIFEKQRSSHAAYIKEKVAQLTENTCERKRKPAWKAYTIPEEFLVQELLCDHWCDYYDDCRYLQQSIIQPEVEECQMLQLLFGALDLNLAKKAMEKDPANYDYLPLWLRADPRIKKMKEETYE